MMSGNMTPPVPASHAIAAPSAPPVENGIPSGLPSSAPSLTAPPVQPNRAQAQLNTIGAQPNQKDYQPIITHPLLRRIGVGLAAFGMGPQAGQEAYNNAFVNPVKHAQQAYENDTQAYNERLKNMNEQTAQDREDRLNEANINHLNAETAGLTNPKPKYQHAVIDDPANPGQPLAVNFDPKSGHYTNPDTEDVIPGAKPWEKPAPPGSDFEQYYKDYIAANKLLDTPQNRLTARRQYAAAGQAPQHEPRQMAVDPDGNVIELKPGMKIPAGTKSVAGDLANGKPTPDEQRRADLSENLNENLDALEDIVKRRPELFGPLAGRWAELKQKFGNDDPDLGKLQTIEHQIGMAQISAHGMRSAQGVQAAADSIMNNLHNGPASMMSSIDAVRKSVKTFSGDVDKAKESKTNTPAKKSAPAKGNNGGGKVIQYDAQGNRISG